jgi:beta-fructofuranosidase
MWECPDFFTLDGKQVLICSPQDMLPEGFEYHNGNGTLCLIGQVDETKKHFTYDHHQTVDYGIDFYAPQTTLAPDGRRIMVGWMQNWDTCDQQGAKERGWFGQMTLPREITIENGRLYQRPVRELEQYRSNKVEYKNVLLDGVTTLDGIQGRTVDMEITIRPKDPEKSFRKFSVWFAQNEQFRTSVSFKPYESVLKLDRKYSGSRRAFINQRRAQVNARNGELKLRIILDRFSAEVFVNDGEQVMSATVMTDLLANGISFSTDGQVEMDITKYDLF